MMIKNINFIQKGRIKYGLFNICEMPFFETIWSKDKRQRWKRKSVYPKVWHL